MILKKGDKKSISPNFTSEELFSKSPDAPNSHFLDDKLVTAAQYLRGWYGVPIRVNSTLRTPNHNKAIGGASKSQHLLGTAIDLSFPDHPEILEKYNNDILKKGDVYKGLRAIGINGFGLYDNFLHIDTRPNYAFWNKKKSLTNLVDSYNDDEDGDLDFKAAKKKGIYIILTIVLVAIVVFYYIKFKK